MATDSTHPAKGLSMVERKEVLQVRKYLWTVRAAKTRSHWLFALLDFSARQKGDASGLPGDDGVPATEGLRCSRGREEHALSCSMELVCGILL